MSPPNIAPQFINLSPSGRVPNSVLPVIVHRLAIPENPEERATFLERLFARAGWGNSWRDGVYPFHHFHSTAHEVLGIAGGRAKLRLGGEGGLDLDVETGAVLILPAGTGHKTLWASTDFLVVGAYPKASTCDLIRSEGLSEAAFQTAARNIARVPCPDRDPVSGEAIGAWRGLD